MAKMTVNLKICEKQKNKVLFRIDFQSLIKNKEYGHIFSVSLSHPSKITENNGKTAEKYQK